MSKPIDPKPLDDLALARLLRDLERPVEPNRRFAERLYVVVRQGAVRRRPTGLYMLAAAALLTTGLLGLAIATGGLAPRPDDGVAIIDPSPTATATSPHPTSVAPTSPAAATVGPPVPSFVESDVMRLDGDVTIGAGSDTVWLGQSVSSGPGTLIRIDTSDQSVIQVPVSPDETASSVRLGEPVVGSRIWMLAHPSNQESTTSWVVSAEVDLPQDPTMVPLPGTYLELGVDDRGQLWGTRWPSGISNLTIVGGIAGTVEPPWGSPDVDDWRASLAPAPAFGSIWAHEPSIPAVHRLDPETGELQATIELSHCEPGGANNYRRSGLIYPITGVDGLPDAMVASCSWEIGPHRYIGPMAIIDPSTNAVAGLVDTVGSFGRGAVLDGKWYVPVVTGGLAVYVVMIDVEGLRPEATIATLRDRAPEGLVAAGDSLWVLSSSNVGDPGVKHLVRLRPE